jgi:hypothetical protein
MRPWTALKIGLFIPLTADMPDRPPRVRKVPTGEITRKDASIEAAGLAKSA